MSNGVNAVVYKTGDLEKRATLEIFTATCNAAFYIKSHLEFSEDTNQTQSHGKTERLLREGGKGLHSQ